jgi:hypothetical protein
MRNNRIYTKSFLAGLAFPAIFIPIIYSIFYLLQHSIIYNASIILTAMQLPLIFAISNIILIWQQKGNIKRITNKLYYIAGAILGIFMSLHGIFILELPTKIFAISGNWKFIFLIIIPIIYALIFRFIVKQFNAIIIS